MLAASMTGPTPVMPASDVAVPVWMNYFGFDKVSLQNGQGVTLPADGKGETVAIVIWNRDASYVDSNSPGWSNSGLARYSVAHRLPTTGFSFEMLNEMGSTTDLPEPSNSNGEFDLDTQTVHTVAPEANIVVVLASSSKTSDINQAIKTAIGLHPAVVSMSFASEETVSTTKTDAMYVPNNGVTYLAAAGDRGAGVQNVKNSPGTTSVHKMESPADKPMIVQVGGTKLDINASGGVENEVAWGSGPNSDIKGGSGGGYSEYVSMPSYQANSPYVQQFLVTSSREVEPGLRLGPDVSMMSEPGLTTLRYSFDQRLLLVPKRRWNEPRYSHVRRRDRDRRRREGAPRQEAAEQSPDSQPTLQGPFNGLPRRDPRQ